MTPKIKGQNYTLLVTAIQNNYKISAKNKNVHLITFKEDDGTIYQAEEAEDFAQSNFVVNVRNTFTVSTPGRSGFLDWIRFCGLERQGKTANGIVGHNLFVAQTALNNAVLLGMQRGWTEEEILDKAFYFAGNIKQIANQLAEEML